MPGNVQYKAPIYDTALWSGTHGSTRGESRWMVCGPNIVSVIHRNNNSAGSMVIPEKERVAELPVYRVSVVPNIGQSKLYPPGSTAWLRKISICNYAYAIGERQECRPVNLMDIYVGIEKSLDGIFDSLGPTKGMVHKFTFNSQTWRDVIHNLLNSVKSDTPAPTGFMQVGALYNPVAVPRGCNPYISMTVEDIVCNFIVRIANVVCTYALNELANSEEYVNLFYTIDNTIYPRIIDPLLKLRAGMYRQLVQYIHDRPASSWTTRLPMEYIREIGIFLNA